MSEAAHHIPFSETKAPESAERLHRGALGLVDISASTMANIGPAYSFYFGFAGMVILAGLASPLVILVAAVAIALLGNTLSQFSRAHPSTGGFITFVGKSFGGTSAVTTALVAGMGYIIAIASVLVISGGFLSIMIQYYTGTNIPWIIFSALFTAGAMFMMFRGVAVSTKLAGFFFAFEITVLFVVSIAVLIKNGGHLSGVPFEPSHITNHFSGLGVAFPLAVYLFIGWENSAALAEETTNPRRNVPRAVFLSIALMAFTYLVVAYATVTGFHYSITALTAPTVLIPFINVAHSVAAWLAFIAYLAGLTSTLGVLIAAVNSQCRLIFNAGREGLLPAWIGRVQPVRRTPVNAIIAFVAIASAITLGWAIGHWIGGTGNSLSAINFFAESATMGTILIVFVYLAANVALPFYYRKYRPGEFNIVKHIVLPALGVVAVGIPIYYLFNPSPPIQPYDWFPWVGLGLIVASIVYAMWLVRRDPGLGDRVGSIIADE
jgi:amino acid transporter